MKNDSKMSKFVAIVLLLTIVALIIVSSTYAKYTSSASGTGTAYVATWNITLDGTSLDKATFDLFSTVIDTSDDKTETDIATVKDTTLIAPGTYGSFDLALVNNSDVPAEITLTLTPEENSVEIPIEFATSLNGTWYTDLADVFGSEDYVIDVGESKTPTIYWRWAYEGSSSTNYTTSQTDESDTGLGVASYTALSSGERTSYNVSVSVTATQVD